MKISQIALFIAKVGFKLYKKVNKPLKIAKVGKIPKSGHTGTTTVLLMKSAETKIWKI